MIYPDTLEHKIGFDGVREHISRLCSSPVGVDRCREMTFHTDYASVSRLLHETAEMLAIISSEAGFPSGNIHDCRAALLALRVPGTWPAESTLPGLRASLAAMADISAFFAKARRDDSNATPYPALDALAADLQASPTLPRQSTALSTDMEKSKTTPRPSSLKSDAQCRQPRPA